MFPLARLGGQLKVELYDIKRSRVRVYRWKWVLDVELFVEKTACRGNIGSDERIVFLWTVTEFMEWLSHVEAGRDFFNWPEN